MASKFPLFFQKSKVKNPRKNFRKIFDQKLFCFLLSTLRNIWAGIGLVLASIWPQFGLALAFSPEQDAHDKFKAFFHVLTEFFATKM